MKAYTQFAYQVASHFHEMYLAVETKGTEMVECLLDHEADINLQDDKEVILYTTAVNYFVSWQVLCSDLQLKLKPYKCNKKSTQKGFSARVIYISASLTFLPHLWLKL